MELCCRTNFTFHYVSINTKKSNEEIAKEVPLHSTMFLLIQKCLSNIIRKRTTLHSTMFLLILLQPSFLWIPPIFTFHYVSINTSSPNGFISSVCTLHSTMFLLIPDFTQPTTLSSSAFTFHYVSINTQRRFHLPQGCTAFTFHYVSINTTIQADSLGSRLSLHSTMFLLIRFVDDVIALFDRTLHSTMFLLIRAIWSLSVSGIIFTFHYVSINTPFRPVFRVCFCFLYIPLCFY